MAFRGRSMRVVQGFWVGATVAALGCAAGCGSSSGAASPGDDGGTEAEADASPDSTAPLDSSMGDSSVADSSMMDSTTGMTDASKDGATATDGGTDGNVTLPIISNLLITPNPNSVLSATLTFTTNVPTTASVTVTNLGDGGASNTFTIGPTTNATTSQSINILGMRSQSSFSIAVTAKDGSGNSAVGAASYATGTLPPAIPPITIVANDPTKTSPGFTMFTIWKWTGTPTANLDGPTSSIVALDPEGQVVWYYLQGGPPTANTPTAPKKLPNGDLLFVWGEAGWSEIDMMGNTVRSYLSSQMGLDSMHHEVALEPSSPDYLGLSTELREVSGYPTGDGGTTTLPIVGDIIAEFNADGGVLNEWHALDMLDPHREGNPAMFNTPFWNGLYTDAGLTKDWTHGNAVTTDPADGNIIASSRTQGWIYKFARTDGGTPTVEWRLGAGGDFTLTNAGETFQYGQHGVNVLPNGNLMMFDNGNNRPGPDGGINQFSRALEYSLDTTNMTATIAWQFQDTSPFFAQFIGSSYQLANGDVLVCAGGLVDNLALALQSPSNLKYARIMEVTHDPVPVKVMEYKVREELGSKPSDPNFSGYSVYRATRITSLY